MLLVYVVDLLRKDNMVSFNKAFYFMSFFLVVPFCDYSKNRLSKPAKVNCYYIAHTFIVTILQVQTLYVMTVWRSKASYMFGIVVHFLEHAAILLLNISALTFNIGDNKNIYLEFIQTFDDLANSLDIRKYSFHRRHFYVIFFGIGFVFFCFLIVVNIIWFYVEGNLQLAFTFQYYAYYVHFNRMFLLSRMIFDIRSMFSDLTECMERKIKRQNINMEIHSKLYRRLIHLVQLFNSFFGLQIFFSLWLSSVASLHYVNMLVFSSKQYLSLNYLCVVWICTLLQLLGLQVSSRNVILVI